MSTIWKNNLSPRLLRYIVLSKPRRLGTQHHRTITYTAQDAAAELEATWKDKTLHREQLLDAHQAQRLSLMLNRPDIHPGESILSSPPNPGTPLPAGYHLVYFTPASLESSLGADGTDKTFNPPGPFVRRMWSGGRLHWHTDNPLRIGDVVQEHTRLLSATPKTSRNGHEMVLVDVEKTFANPRGVAVVDRRAWIFQPDDMAAARVTADALPEPRPLPYRSEVRDERGASEGGRGGGRPVRHLTWSPVALFRFSALTYNAHLFHYSEPWCREREGFPGIVVHGPLNLINMLDYWRDVCAKDTSGLPSSIQYRALKPLFAGSSYRIHMEETTDGDADGLTEVVVSSGKDTLNMKGSIHR